VTGKADGAPSASNDQNGVVKANNNMEADKAYASPDMEADEPYGSQYDSDQGYNPTDYDSDSF